MSKGEKRCPADKDGNIGNKNAGSSNFGHSYNGSDDIRNNIRGLVKLEVGFRQVVLFSSEGKIITKVKGSDMGICDMNLTSVTIQI